MASKTQPGSAALRSGVALAAASSHTPESLNDTSSEQASAAGNQLSAGELKNILSMLSSQSGANGISLEQLLSGGGSGVTSPSKPATPPLPTPKTPQQHQTPRSLLRSSSSLSQAGHTPTLAPSTPTGVTGPWSGRKRARPFDLEESSKRRRSGSYNSRQSGEKQHNKGLRHFSQRVCEKVREKGTTTYNEVADELVKELTESEKRMSGAIEVPIDHKNIRRRVYDALNVLMAMNIISKEKKEIRWIGLPTNSVQECQHIEGELAQAEERIRGKRSQVEDLLIQILTFKNLMKRNRDRVSALGGHAQNSAIALPFIIVNTGKKTTIDCSISSDKSEYVFNFDSAFELHNDIDVLKKMGLDCGLHTGTFTAEDIRQAKTMLPKAFESTLDEIAATKNVTSGAGSLPHTPISYSSSSASPSLPAPSLTSTPNLVPSTPPLAHPLTPPTSSLTPSHSSSVSPHFHAMAGSPSQAPISPLASSLSAAAVLSNLAKQINAAAQGLTAAGSAPGGSPVRLAPAPGKPQGTAQVTIPSPRAVTALMNTALRAKQPTPIAARPLSPLSNPRHAHCPQGSPQAGLSPLVKSSLASPAAIPATPPAAVSSSMATLQQLMASQLPPKSPAPKIVTASKLPVTSEQLNSFLQQAIQNPSLLKGMGMGLTDGPTSLTNGAGLDGAVDSLVSTLGGVPGQSGVAMAAGQNGTASPSVHVGSVLNGLSTTMAL